MIRPNQLNGAVGNAETMGTTRERAKRVKMLLLNLRQAFRTRVSMLIVNKFMFCAWCSQCQGKVAGSVVEYVTYSYMYTTTLAPLTHPSSHSIRLRLPPPIYLQGLPQDINHSKKCPRCLGERPRRTFRHLSPTRPYRNVGIP